MKRDTTRTIACPCGKTFHPWEGRPESKFCSKDCRTRYGKWAWSAAWKHDKAAPGVEGAS